MKICPHCQRCYDDDDGSCADCKKGLRVLPINAPRRIESHRLERRLGGGGMGMVFEAADLNLNRSVAIKILQMDVLLDNFRDGHPQLADDQEALEKFRDEMARRFRREARAAASIDDSNVVKIFSHGVLAPGADHDDTAYIVMELVEGQPLQRFLKQHPDASPGQLVSIARQVAAAIKAAHRKGVVHRDLKPSNIMVRLDEEDGEVLAKVVDFGIAKLMEQSSAGLTKTGTMVGTVQYMSPEQCSGGEADKRSDIYSLGVVMYEMLAGRPPFAAPNLAALAHQHIYDEPTPLGEFRPELPPPLAELIMRSLRKNPAERPQTASEVATALRRIELSLILSSLEQTVPGPPPFAGNEHPTLINNPSPAPPEVAPDESGQEPPSTQTLAPDIQSPAIAEPDLEAEALSATAPAVDEGPAAMDASEAAPSEAGTVERHAVAAHEAADFAELKFSEICERFDSSFEEVSSRAARELYDLAPSVQESFTRALREATPERRRQIGAAISSSGLAAEALSNLTGETREKTYEAFSLLFLMAKAGEVAPLVRAIGEHPNNEVRLAVVKLLTLSGQKEVLPDFRRLAVRGSLPTEVRSAVMEAIYQISSNQRTPAL